MNGINSADISGYLINQATSMSTQKVQQSVQTAVLRKLMDQQEQQGQALVKMIQQTAPQPGEPGSVIDIRV